MSGEAAGKLCKPRQASGLEIFAGRRRRRRTGPPWGARRGHGFAAFALDKQTACPSPARAPGRALPCVPVSWGGPGARAGLLERLRGRCCGQHAARDLEGRRRAAPQAHLAAAAGWAPPEAPGESLQSRRHTSGRQSPLLGRRAEPHDRGVQPGCPRNRIVSRADWNAGASSEQRSEECWLMPMISSARFRRHFERTRTARQPSVHRHCLGARCRCRCPPSQPRAPPPFSLPAACPLIMAVSMSAALHAPAAAAAAPRRQQARRPATAARPAATLAGPRQAAAADCALQCSRRHLQQRPQRCTAGCSVRAAGSSSSSSGGSGTVRPGPHAVVLCCCFWGSAAS